MANEEKQEVTLEVSPSEGSMHAVGDLHGVPVEALGAVAGGRPPIHVPPHVLTQPTGTASPAAITRGSE